jgi:hypothetical protein
MIRKLLLTTAILSFVWVSAAAQSIHADLSYQSFRPFINFSVELGSYDSYQRDSYQSAYLKGYMDGVNRSYYDDYRFYELVHDIEAYEDGYRDGYRDQALFSGLRGYERLSYRPFEYDDYYSPYYSVQLWLNEISFTFLSVPSYRLPRHWSRRAHPSLRRYRTHFKNKRYHSRYKKQYKRHEKRLRKRARYNQRSLRKRGRNYGTYSGKNLNKERARQRVRNAPSRTRSVKRSRSRRNQSIRSRPQRSLDERSYRTVRNRNNKASTRKRIKSRSVKSREVKRKHSRRTKVKSNHRTKSRNVEPKRSGKRKVNNQRSGKRKKIRSRSRSGIKSRGKVKRSRSRKDTSRNRRGGNN